MKKLLILLFLTLSGCGGSTPSAPSASVITGRQAVLIAEYGDSIAWGQTLVNGVYTQSVPTEEQVSTETINDPLIFITDHGDGGATAADWLNGDTVGDIQFQIPVNWATTMSNEPADVVIVEFGWNDDAVKHFTVDQFMTNIDSLVQGIKAAGKIPIIETTSPASRSDLIGAETNVIENYVAAELSYGQTHIVCVIDQYNYLKTTYGASWAQYLSDGIHPTMAGYNIKGKYQASVLKPFLENRVN